MSDGSLPLDTVLGLCQNRHRRVILGILTEEQRSLTLSDLTEAVLKYTHQTPIAEASEYVLTGIRLSLHHVHLPKLASEGLIDYDPRHQIVDLTEQLEQVQPVLSTILSIDPALETPMKL